MTGSALNLALTLVVLHVELESVKHRSAALWKQHVLCRGLRDSNLFPLDPAQKVGPETCKLQN